ncbi:MAG: RIP metalloprotease RseP [Bacillota bacterium]
MQTLLAAIFVFGLLILAHELGHYFVARATGVRVLELAIGFGPRLIGWTRNNINYSLRAVPLGGFCKMLGEDPEEADQPGSFPQQSIPVRASVLLAGSVMNLILAVIVFFIVFFFLVGVPGDSAQLGYIVEDSPAEEAGLKAGDVIRSIEGEPVEAWDNVLAKISEKPEEEISLAVERDGTVNQYQIETEAEPETGRGIIGIGPQMQRFSLISSLQSSFQQFGMFIYAIYDAFFGDAPLDVAGPVGIVHTIGEVAQVGFANLLVLTGLISINLGIINLLPVPALDGGRLVFLIVEAIRGRPIEPEKEGLVHFIGFAVLIMLILMITYQDIIRFIISPSN